MQAIKSVFKIVAVNLGILLGLAVVAELIFGDWISPRDFGALNLPRNMQRTFDVSGLYPGGTTATYTRDDHGLRGDYGSLGAIDMLALGGSTTNELYVSDGQTWVDVLEAGLKQDNPKWTVVNAAVDGQSTIGHLYNFDAWFPNLPELKPKYVIALIGVNDVHVEGQARYDSMESEDPVRRFTQWFKNKSALNTLYLTVRGMMEANKAKLVHGDYTVPRGPWVPVEIFAGPRLDEGQLGERIAAYRERVGALIDRVRHDFGGEAIIVTQSRSDYRVENGSVYALDKPDGSLSTGTFVTQNAFNQAAMAACAEKGAICIDLGSDLRFGDDDFYDWVHTTPSGSKKIGEYLAQHLKGRIAPK